MNAAARDLRLLALAWVILVALACGHSDPFSSTPYGSTEPFDPTPPIRLTLNETADRSPAWLPDGDGIVYSTQPLGRADGDLCLAELPATGGSQRRLICDAASIGPAATEAIESPVVGPDGRLAFVRATSAVGAVTPDLQRLEVGPGMDASAAAEVQRVPYTIPGEPIHTGLIALRWQRADRLIFVGGGLGYRRLCLTCVLDTVVAGRKVVTLDLTPAGSVLSAVPRTEFASGVAAGASDDEILYTVGGDTRVFRRVLSTGEVAVAHDFGAAGVARDVHVAGGRLTATVGGRVAVSVDPDLGPLQWDSGGIIHVVDLASGADVTLDGPGLFRRPALAPDGRRVVAEGYPLLITSFTDPATGAVTADTTVSHAGDLYLFADR